METCVRCKKDRDFWYVKRPEVCFMCHVDITNAELNHEFKFKLDAEIQVVTDFLKNI